jgi:thiol-disulfide isomerase/thioredoxin
MRSNFLLLLLSCIIIITANAQEPEPPLLNIGDPAPPLSLREWIKGTPVQRFEKSQVYVLEFWATWCRPCKAAMPHLSGLAREYKGKVTFIGIDIYELKTTSMANVKSFVDSMGKQMDYRVAAGDSNFMETDWIDASGDKRKGIPISYVVNSEGRLAWIGHPKDLGEVLPKIVNNTWNITEVLARRNLDRHLAYLDLEAYYDLSLYWPDPLKPGDPGKPDSALAMIDKIIKKEPKLKYTPHIAYTTFSSLLNTDLHKAYQYGKLVMVTATYEEPDYSSIYNAINSYLDTLKLPPEIYGLGAEAYQSEIDHLPYPEIVNTPQLYHNMATFYWRANEPSKAIDAEQKAIEALKNKRDFSKTDLAVFELQLEQYRKR